MVAIIQPFIPDYREEFFKGIANSVDTDIYVFEKNEKAAKSNFKLSSLSVKNLLAAKLKGILFYSPILLLNKRYHHLVLILHFAHLTTWLLLLTKFIHRKKITIWGQGVSIKRYLKEEQSPDIRLKLMIYLSDGLWVYTEKEKEIWQRIFPEKEITALNNTISDIDRALTADIDIDKTYLKNKFKINQEVCLIFCARFNNSYRRVDLLEKLIRHLDNKKFGFVIIGDGPSKPDFSMYTNVYDFGAVYDRSLKNELFTVADLYFQPGWVGLSIVEAMAYGKPILTYSRSEEILQCVEYSYIKNGQNGLLFSSYENSVSVIQNLSLTETLKMGERARVFVRENLMMSMMISNAVNTLKS